MTNYRIIPICLGLRAYASLWEKIGERNPIYQDRNMVAGLREAADTIETLIEALIPFADIAGDLSDNIGDRKNTMYWAIPYAGDLRRALDVIEKMGVKL